MPGPGHSLAAPRVLQRGLTLIELLVACALGLLVLGGVALMFGGTTGNRLDVERSGRLTENAAYALELLSEEIRVAAYFAETKQVGVTWQVPDPCATAIGSLGFAVAPFSLPVGIEGYRPSDPTPACLTHRKAGTAAIVVRRLDVDTTPPADATGAPFWQVSSCAADIVTLAYSNTPAAFTMHQIDCAAIAPIRKVIVRAYYVSTCNDCGNDSTPTLKRAELVGNQIVVTPLVEGVDNLQIEYGFDTNNDGNADVYRDTLSGVAGAADNSWANVVAARIYVLGRSTDAATGYVDATKRFYMGPAGYTTVANDGYKRVQLAAMVRLNNPAGMRETP